MVTEPVHAASPKRIADVLSLAVLAAVAVIAALTFRDYGLGWDDFTHAEYGGLLLRLYSSGFTDQRALSFVNLYAYGGGFDMLAALAAKILPFDLFDTRRMVGAAIGLAGLFLTWRLARRIGGPLAGLIATGLLAACPLYYGHMYMNAKDSPFAAAMILLTLGLVRAFQEYPRPSPPVSALVGVGVGLAIGTRVMGGIGSTYVVAALALILAVEARTLGFRAAIGRTGVFLATLLPAFVLAYAVMALVWPWSVTEPLNPLRAVEYFSHFFEKPWKEMFGGQVMAVPDMPRSYVPQLMLLKEPEILLGLGLAGVIGAFAIAARPSVAVKRRAVFLFLGLSAIFPVVLTVLTKPAMYNGVRHFLFIMPPLAVLAGFAGARAIEWLGARWRPLAPAGALAIAAAAALPVAEMIKLHPYQYTHFNHIAGGVRGAGSRYMLDYWGLAFKQAAQELHAKLSDTIDVPAARRRWRIAVCGPQRPAQVELGPGFVTTWDARGADFALTLGEFYCAAIKAPVLVEIEREGVVYARVYDIRGRSVSSLLTLPPP